MTSPAKFSLGLPTYYVAVGVPFLLAGFAVSAPFAAYNDRSKARADGVRGWSREARRVERAPRPRAHAPRW